MSLVDISLIFLKKIFCGVLWARAPYFKLKKKQNKLIILHFITDESLEPLILFKMAKTFEFPELGRSAGLRYRATPDHSPFVPPFLSYYSTMTFDTSHILFIPGGHTAAASFPHFTLSFARCWACPRL